MEITFEEEMMENEPKTINLDPPKIIKIYPYDDDHYHLAYIVKPDEFQKAYDILVNVYDNWNVNAWDEEWGVDELEEQCDRALDRREIFNCRFVYSAEGEDPFNTDEMIG